jgi:hypothetical protein
MLRDDDGNRSMLLGGGGEARVVLRWKHDATLMQLARPEQEAPLLRIVPRIVAH